MTKKISATNLNPSATNFSLLAIVTVLLTIIGMGLSTMIASPALAASYQSGPGGCKYKDLNSESLPMIRVKCGSTTTVAQWQPSTDPAIFFDLRGKVKKTEFDLTTTKNQSRKTSSTKGEQTRPTGRISGVYGGALLKGSYTRTHRTKAPIKVNIRGKITLKGKQYRFATQAKLKSGIAPIWKYQNTLITYNGRSLSKNNKVRSLISTWLIVAVDPASD